MILSFKCKETEKVFHRKISKKWSLSLIKIAKRKLNLIDAAHHLQDLRIPPGNKLEKLSGDRLNLYSIRINDQWRICFKWMNSNAYQVEIIDYH